ncbi:NmrA domain-containing protein, partial [Favolaschia claudopus]
MPIITIFGATGLQGSSVLEAVLADGSWTPRAVSRSLDSPQSKALIARGVEVVVGNLWEKESVKKAMRGSDAVFGNTNFWDPEVLSNDHQGKGEIVQGRNLVDAAKEEGIKFFLYSSLPNATKESNGVYTKIYHVDNKAAIEEYLRGSGVPFAVILAGSFAENMWRYNVLKKTPANSYQIAVPKFAPEDIQSMTWVGRGLGQAAVALLTNYQDPTKAVLGKRYPVISWRVRYPEFAAAIAKAIKKEVKFISLESAGNEEYDEMFAFQAKVGFYLDTPVPNPDLVALGVNFGTVEEFVEREIVPRYA